MLLGNSGVGAGVATQGDDGSRAFGWILMLTTLERPTFRSLVYYTSIVVYYTLHYYTTLFYRETVCSMDSVLFLWISSHFYGFPLIPMDFL